MRTAALILGTSLLLCAQGSNQTLPQPNPYGPGLRPNQPTRSTLPRAQRTTRLRGGGGYFGGGTHEVIVETPAPIKEDPLKDLVISPVYQREKITPKMIEIP
ncbi:MAG: hypothetical protein NTW74_13445 [Acidobacteria bacterium]|nr:hypothetical protein [Acidobacteriota bacterium]